MGLFDSIAGSVLGKLGGDQGGMAQVAMEMFNENGGLNGVIEKFKAGGLGEQLASWVGKGENLPVTAAQITNIIGNGQLAAMAAKFGFTPEMLSSQIAEHLPKVIDKLTPNGEVSGNSNHLLSTALGLMK